MIIDQNDNYQLCGCRDIGGAIDHLCDESEVEFYSIYYLKDGASDESEWQCIVDIRESKEVAQSIYDHLTKDVKSYYYVFGSEACRLYEEGYNRLKKATKSGRISPEIFMYTENMHPNVLLNVLCGYEYYMELTEVEYYELKSLGA
jgi:hypothetical protein